MFYAILAMIVLFVALIYFKTKNYVDYLHNCIDDYEITIRDLRSEREELLQQIKIQNENDEIFGNIKREIEDIEKENELNTQQRKRQCLVHIVIYTTTLL